MNKLSLFKTNFEAAVFLFAHLIYIAAVSLPQLKSLTFVFLIAMLVQGIKESRLALLYFITVVLWPVPLVGLPLFKIAVALILIKVAVDVVTKGLSPRFNTNLVYLYSFWVVYTLAISIFAPADVDTYKYIERSLRGFIAFIAIIQLIKNEREITSVIAWIVIAGGLNIIINISHYKTGLSAEWIMASFENPYKELNRVIPWGAEPNYYTSMMIVTIGLSYGLMGYFKQKSTLLLFIFAAAGCHAAIFGTYSKSGLLAIGLTAFVFVLAKPSRLVYMIPFGLIALVGILSQESLLDRYSRIYENIVEKGGTGRFTLWGWALQSLIDNPLNIISGNGMGWFLNKYGHAAHNTFLTMLVDGGIILMGTFIGLIVGAYNKIGICMRYYRSQMNKRLILLQGMRASIIGTVAMYMTVTDLGGISMSLLLAIALVEYGLVIKRLKTSAGAAE